MPLASVEVETISMLELTEEQIGSFAAVEREILDDHVRIVHVRHRLEEVGLRSL